MACVQLSETKPLYDVGGVGLSPACALYVVSELDLDVGWSWADSARRVTVTKKQS